MTSIVLLSGSLNSMDQEVINGLYPLVVWNVGHTSLFALPYKVPCLLPQAVSITERWLFWEALKTLKAKSDHRAPLPKHVAHTEESLSFAIPGNHICLSSTQSQPTNRPTPWNQGRAFSYQIGGLGTTEPWIQLNHISVWMAQRASESGGVRVRRPELCTGAQCIWPVALGLQVV